MTTPAKPLYVQHYTEAACIALTQAKVCRDASLRPFSPFGRHIERVLMREYAREWRNYLLLARRYTTAA